jgi:phage gpG-like protein
MATSGASAGMGLLAANLRKLAGVPSRVSREVSGELRDLIEEEFDAGADPYGDSWAPILPSTEAQRSQTTLPPLSDRERMRESLRVRPARGAGVAITIDDPAGIHQTGWKNGGNGSSGPARPILPRAGFPARWREAIDAATERQIEVAMKEGG